MSTGTEIGAALAKENTCQKTNDIVKNTPNAGFQPATLCGQCHEAPFEATGRWLILAKKRRMRAMRARTLQKTRYGRSFWRRRSNGVTDAPRTYETPQRSVRSAVKKTLAPCVQRPGKIKPRIIADPRGKEAAAAAVAAALGRAASPALNFAAASSSSAR